MMNPPPFLHGLHRPSPETKVIMKWILVIALLTVVTATSNAAGFKDAGGMNTVYCVLRE